jgi:methyl-accepting chemotaxis protein
MQEKKKDLRKRTIYVIDESFQLKYSLLFALTGLLVSALVGVVVYGYSMAHDNVLLVSGLEQSPDMVSFFHDQHKILLVKIITLSAIITLFLFLMGLIVTHRIAGPIFSIKRVMNQISENGDLNARVRLRKADEFKSLAEAFNGMMEKIIEKCIK